MLSSQFVVPQRVLQRVIGSAAGALTRAQSPAGECALGDVVADAMQAGSRTWGGNVVTFLSPRELHADLTGPGPSGTLQITYGMAQAALPPGQANTTTNLTGAQLLRALEEQFQGGVIDPARIMQVSQGLRYTWDPTLPAGQWVVPGSVTVDGVVVNPVATYRVTVSDYLLAGGDGLTVFGQGTPIPDGADTGQELDLLAAYLATRASLSVPTLDRISRANA